jgi:hypothetical protein
MNRAIDTQVDKQLELSSLYEHQQTSRLTQIFMHVTVSLCALTLTAAAMWWFLSSGDLALAKPNHTDPATLALSDRKTIDALTIISDAQKTSESPDSAFINTSFTVFHRTLISTGEYVVTGKTYAPSNLRKPYEQYCYLEQNQNSQALSGHPLSYVEAGELVLETEDQAMIVLAKKYCQFSR